MFAAIFLIIHFLFVLDLPLEKFPNITAIPRIQAGEGVSQSVVFTCSFNFTARSLEKARFQASWFRPVTFYGGKYGKISLFSEIIQQSPSTYTAIVGVDIPLGETVKFLIFIVLYTFILFLTLQGFKQN